MLRQLRINPYPQALFKYFKIALLGSKYHFVSLVMMKEFL